MRGLFSYLYGKIQNKHVDKPLTLDGVFVKAKYFERYLEKFKFKHVILYTTIHNRKQTYMLCVSTPSWPRSFGFKLVSTYPNA